jgi:hypothetical protein
MFTDHAYIADIGCMELSAIKGRGTMKDHAHLHRILQRIPLKGLLALCALKLPQLDRALIRKALACFDDLEAEPVLFRKTRDVPFEEVKRALRSQAARGY